MKFKQFKLPEFGFTDKSGEEPPHDEETVTQENKEMEGGDKEKTDSDSQTEAAVEYQQGDEAMRAITQIWTKKHLVIAYVLYVSFHSENCILQLWN